MYLGLINIKRSPNGLGRNKCSPAPLSTHLFNPLAFISFFGVLDSRKDSQKEEDKLPELSGHRAAKQGLNEGCHWEFTQWARQASRFPWATDRTPTIIMDITIIVVGQILWKRTLSGDLHAGCLIGRTLGNSTCKGGREAGLGRLKN